MGIVTLLIVHCFWQTMTVAHAELSTGDEPFQAESLEQDFSEPATASAVVSPLKKVTHVKAVRFSTHRVKITWKKQKKAKYYRVYYSLHKKGKYKLAGVTKKDHFLVKHLKKNKKYYFYVQASRTKKASLSDSKPSRIRSIRTKTYRRNIVFAGDSICEGITSYGVAFPKMHSDAKKKTVAYRGLNTVTYHTKRVFGGRTGLQKLISEHPYRVYIMLGLNEIHYRKASQILKEYKALVQSLRQASPNTDVVFCSISPVTRAERASHPGMGQIPKFNRKLKKMAKKMGCHYVNYTAFLKDSHGYLKSQYAAADGFHWKAPAYAKFGRVIGKYDKSLDF
jgi:lysophospholipase L1-like esterase